MEKTKKVIAGIVSTALLLAAASCGSAIQEESFEEEEYGDTYSSETTLENEGNAVTLNDDQDDLLPIPEDEACAEWEWDYDDGVWECEDSNSSFFGHYFYAGTYYNNKSNLYNSSAYIDYQNSAEYKGTKGSTNSTNLTTSSSTVSNGTVAKGSSGFGSSSSYSGG
ncbi:MAG: hypothetical protein AB2401_01385 [Bacillus sp. (in: firmicutes)]|uniref:hypothetical protein n=1 Tax=Bacillus marasmi TaxID=1926279 RepID=UPI001FE8F7C5|nr:hypothetical protein [Bacillus marasmi]